jgi:hypothetical protein
MTRKKIAFGWYGGKYSHLEWLLGQLPDAHHYCEPFGGSAAVLLNREPAPVETYNDVDGNERVLGGSPEPYVNNPLRVPGITAAYRNAQKQKTDWDKLVAVLDAYVVNFADFALGILILFGEDGRVQFLSEVGSELDRVNARIEHRRAWANLLKQA